MLYYDIGLKMDISSQPEHPFKHYKIFKLASGNFYLTKVAVFGASLNLTVYRKLVFVLEGGGGK